MYHHEIIWLENCPLHFKLTVYRQFVDDTFLLFRSMDHVEKFKNYLNKQHKNKIYVWNWGKWLCHLLSGGHRLKFGWRLSTMRGGGKLNTYIWIIVDPLGREGRGGGGGDGSKSIILQMSLMDDPLSKLSLGNWNFEVNVETQELSPKLREPSY